MGKENPVTAEEEDGVEIALTYPIWMKTCDAYIAHPSSGPVIIELATMVKTLIEINKHDSETIGYLNSRANQAMRSGELHYDEH